VRRFSELSDDSLKEILTELADNARSTLTGEGVPEDQQRVIYSADLRYHGQGFEIPVTIDLDAFDGDGGGLDSLSKAFDAEHHQLFSFVLDAEHELVTVRATANGPKPDVAAAKVEAGGEDAGDALVTKHDIWVDGAEIQANIYDRGLLKAGNVVAGPAIVTEMDSTTLVLPGHAATVHPSGSLLIRPLESNTEN
jgi:N-methylhydantoinase A